MAKKLASGFEIFRFSDTRYEKITAEIQFKGEQIAQLNIDRGEHSTEIEIFTEFIGNAFTPKFRLKDFLEAVYIAVDILNESS